MQFSEDQKIFVFNQQTVAIEVLFQAVIDYTPYQHKQQSDQNYQASMDVYNCYYICQYISAQVIDKLEMSQLNTKRGCDIVDFVRVMINVIPHHDTENLYVAIAVIDLFREIKQAQTNIKDTLKLQDLTDFICEKYKLIYKDHRAKIKFTPPIKQKQNLYPLEVFYDANNQNLIIATTKDLRLISIKDGMCTIAFKKLFNEPEDEITVFRTFNFDKQAIIGNQRGELNMYDLTNGEKISSLKGHANDINQIQIDFLNKMIVTSGYDLTIINQLITGHKFEVKRKIINSNFKKIITIMELSVHHNLLVTCSESNVIYVWDYEFNRLQASIQLDSEASPTCVCFINGLSIIFVGSTKGDLLMIYFEKNEVIVSLRLLGMMNLKYAMDLGHKTNDQRFNRNTKRVSQLFRNFTTLPDDPIHRLGVSGSASGDQFQRAFEDLQIPVIANKILCDYSVMQNQDSLVITRCILYLGLSKGDLATYNLSSILNKFVSRGIISYTPHANKRQNYNPYRSSNEDFLVSHSKTKIVNLNIWETRMQDHSPSPTKSVPHPFLTSNSISFIDSKNSNVKQIKIEHLEVYVDKVVKAHSKKLSVLTLISLDKNQIVTSSPDGYIIIWDSDTLEIIGQSNINQQYPKQWKIQVNNLEQNQKKILFALKTIEVILNKYSHEITKEEQKIISVNKLLDILFENGQPSSQSIKSLQRTKTKMHTQPQENSVKNYEPLELQRLIELSENNRHNKTSDAEIYQFLNPNYRNVVSSPHQELPTLVDNTNNAYSRLVRQLGKREKLMQNVVAKTSFIKHSSSSQKRVQQVSAHKFRSIATLKMRDSDSDHSIDRSNCGDQQPSKTLHTQATRSNFYNYASLKSLIHSQSSQMSMNSTDTQLFTNKKVFGEVLESLQRNKKRAQKSKDLIHKIASQNYLRTPQRVVQIDQSVSKIVSSNLPQKDPTFEQKVQTSIMRTKQRVSNMLNDISTRKFTQNSPDSISRFVSDPDFNHKLSFASTNGFSQVNFHKFKQ